MNLGKMNTYTQPANVDWQGYGGQLGSTSPTTRLPQMSNPGQPDLSWDPQPVANQPSTIPIGMGVAPINERDR